MREKRKNKNESKNRRENKIKKYLWNNNNPGLIVPSIECFRIYTKENTIIK